MFRSIIDSSLKFRFLVLVITATIIIFGVSQLSVMPVDVLPEFSPPYVEIQTESLGLSAKEVEQMITVPMEQDLLAGVAWLDVIRSESVPGLSSVLVLFEPGTDLYRARQMVAERLAQAAVGLPNVSQPPTMIQPLSSASRFMIIGLSSKELSLIQMSVLARWTIAPRLMGVPGVAHVAIWGNRDRQLQVQVDPEHLQDMGVTLQQVVETTGNALWVSTLSYLEASTPGSGGFIDTPNQRLGVWHVLPIKSPEDLAQVPVQGTALLLRDVATVVEDHQLLIGDALVNDSTNLMLVIEKLPEVNALQVTRDLEEALEALRPGFSSIDFDATLFRPATYIEMAISNLTRALVISALLVVLVLGAFFYGWRIALISLIAIVVSLVAALFILYLRGATLNVMVLAGLVIALGAIIDEAVLGVDRVVQRLRHKSKEDSGESETHTRLSPKEIILEVSTETRGTLLFATLVIILPVLIVFFMESLTGAFFRPLAVSYILAVLTALAVALTVTPALSLTILSNASIEKLESPLIPWLQRGYKRILEQTINRPRWVYTAVALLTVVSLLGLPILRQNQDLVPSFQEPYLTIQLEAAPGTSHTAMSRIVAQASRELRAIPGVSNVSAHIGRAVFGDKVVGINYAELWVVLDPQADRGITVNAVEETMNGYSGLDSQVRTYLQQVINQAQTNSSDDLTVRIYGEDHTLLRGLAEKFVQVLAGINGVVDPHIVLPEEEPTVEIEVDLSIAQRYGVKPGDVRRAAATLLSGIQVGSLFEEQKVFDVVVWSTPETRARIDDIRQLLIDTPGGGHVRLGDVADVRIVASPTVIRREGVSPYLDILFHVQGRDSQAVISEAKAVIKNLGFPLEYHAVVLDDYAARQGYRERLLIFGIMVILGIYLLLQASFGSWRLAAAVLLTLPAALSGGVLAAFLGENLISLASLFGLLTILGIVVRNEVMTINHYQRLEQQEGEDFRQELVLRGSHERIAPIIMTGLSTGLALLPLVVFGNIPGLEVVRPTAIVILGGLVTSTLLNLVVVPLLYLRFGSSIEADVFSQSFIPQPDLSASTD